MADVRRAAVLGSPIAHSLSPLLHRAAYRALGLEQWRYDAHECDEQRFPAFLAGLDDTWAGLSLTMPLKREGLRCAGQVGATAAYVGAANTLIRRSGVWLAENTDAPGMADALRAAGVESVDSAVIVGAGGTAQAALVALSMLQDTPPETVIAVREPARAAAARDTAGRLRTDVEVRRLAELPQLLATADVVISTVPIQASSALAELAWKPETVLFDALYAPWPTPAAAAAQRAGSVVISGLELLLYQAAHQVRLMTGSQPPLAAMREALAACSTR